MQPLHPRQLSLLHCWWRGILWGILGDPGGSGSFSGDPDKIGIVKMGDPVRPLTPYYNIKRGVGGLGEEVSARGFSVADSLCCRSGVLGLVNGVPSVPVGPVTINYDLLTWPVC